MEKLISGFNRINFKLFFYLIIPVSIIAFYIFEYSLKQNISTLEFIDILLFNLFITYAMGFVMMILFSLARAFYGRNPNPLSIDSINSAIRNNLIKNVVESGNISFKNYNKWVFASWILLIITHIINNNYSG